MMKNELGRGIPPFFFLVREAELRPRKLRILRPAASGRAHSLRCSSFPHATRFAGLARGPLCFQFPAESPRA